MGTSYCCAGKLTRVWGTAQQLASVVGVSLLKLKKAALEIPQRKKAGQRPVSKPAEGICEKSLGLNFF